MKISLFIPCIVDHAAPETARAAVRLLERLGHTVEFNPSQTCCGQAMFNAGFRKEARDLAERFIRVFSHAEVIVAPSGSCTSMVRNHYGMLDLSASYRREWELLKERIFELTVFLADNLDIDDVGAVFPHTVAIHNSCHALRELNVDAQPRRLLQHVRGLTLTTVNTDNECCGFGGVFSFKYAELSKRIAERRAESLCIEQPEFVTGVDDSCLINLKHAFRRLNMRTRTIHIAKILASEGKMDKSDRP